MTEEEILVRQLTGRAAFLRDRGEIKSPQLMEQAARALSQSPNNQVEEISAAEEKLGLTQADIDIANEAISFSERLNGSPGHVVIAAMLARQAASPKASIPDVEAVDGLRNAALDALSGWRYIRAFYGDLSGVGWDRVEEKLTAALKASQ